MFLSVRRVSLLSFVATRAFCVASSVATAAACSKDAQYENENIIYPPFEQFNLDVSRSFAGSGTTSQTIASARFACTHTNTVQRCTVTTSLLQKETRPGAKDGERTHIMIINNLAYEFIIILSVSSSFLCLFFCAGSRIKTTRQGYADSCIVDSVRHNGWEEGS